MSAQIKVDDLFFVRDRTLRRQPPSSLVAGAPVSAGARSASWLAQRPEVRSPTVELLRTFSPFLTVVIYYGTLTSN